jgi:uncharacterized NAD(P)/FAD-binding protein YdhS
MNIQSRSDVYESNTVVAFPPGAKEAIPPMCRSTRQSRTNHLKLLHKAAGVTEQNSRHALGMAQKLSHQLRAAEDRIAELEAEVDLYRETSDRAEQWLHKVYTEIEERFIRQADDKRFSSAGRRV